MVREWLALLYGNELTIGIVMAVWMILTAAGSLAAYKECSGTGNDRKILHALLLLNFLPLLSIAWMYLLRLNWIPVGVLTGGDHIFLMSILALFPFCFFSGYLFVVLVVFLRERLQRPVTGLVYSYESFGSVLGGLVFNVLLIYFLTVTQILVVLFLVNMVILLILGFQTASRRWYGFAIMLMIAIPALYLSTDWDILRRKVLLPGQNIIYDRETPYGILTVTEQEEQKNYYENHQWVYSSGEIQRVEETVHFVMVQHPHPQRILIITAGLIDLIEELIKYNPQSIDYTCINPWWLKDAPVIPLSFAERRIRLIHEEPRQFLRRSTAKYDVIIMDVPEPATAALNRYFTVEFVQQLKNISDEQTVVMVVLSSSADYLSEEKRKTHSAIYQTFASGYHYARIFPGERDYLLLSDQPLSVKITDRIKERKIPTRIVNAYYIQDDWLEQRSATIHASLEAPSEINRDFKPLAYLQVIRLWLSSVGYSGWLAGLIVLLIIAILIRFGNPYGWSMMIIGMSGVSAEILLLIIFQILFANIYYLIGILVAIFMAGLALGSRFQKDRGWSRRKYMYLQGILAVGIFLAFGFIQLFSSALTSVVTLYLVPCLSLFLIAFISGMLFQGATILDTGTTRQNASRLYGLDMAGAGIGTIGVTVLMFPVFGLPVTSVVLASINLMGIGIIALFTKRDSDG